MAALDERLGAVSDSLLGDCVLGIRRFRLGRVFHGFRTQCLDVDRLVAESAGQIHVERGLAASIRDSRVERFSSSTAISAVE